MREIRIPIEFALSMRNVKVYCNGATLRVVAPGWGCRYSAPYAMTVANLAAVYNAGMVCEIVPAPEGASDIARALVD